MNTKPQHYLFQPSALILFTLLLTGAAPASSITPPNATRAELSVPGWSGWTSMGRPSGILEADGPVVGKNLDGRLELFIGAQTTVGGERSIYRQYQTQPDGAWSDWARFGED